ncbi:MAG: phospholipase family protein [Cyanobacteria bacterium RYN_339]|nr:phospholipase family protein [Cyanobacteria bacterium RYN_339]
MIENDRPIGSTPAPRIRAVGRLPQAGARLASAAPSDGLHRIQTRVFTDPTTRNQLTLHVSAAESRQALLGAIAEAKQSFFIQTFEWHDDQAGNAVIQALAARIRQAKAQGRPFDAKVIIDWNGMQDRAGDEAVVRKLQAIGVDVQVFHPGYLNDGRISPLSHRKLYIQDGDKFLTGGRNIGDEYLGAAYTDAKGVRQNGWHDLLVTIEGEETSRAIVAFFQDWVQNGGHPPDAYPETHPHPTGTAKVQTFITDPDSGEFSLRRTHRTMIAEAKREIMLVVPYLSDATLIDDLIAAKRRNPQLSVKVLLPSVNEGSTGGDVYALLNPDNARRLAAAGVEVRMFGGGHEGDRALSRFSHMKAMVVDRQLLSVGSANGDTRSYETNHENITVIDDAAAVNDFMARVALPDWADGRSFDARKQVYQDPLDSLKTQVLQGFNFLF